MNDEEIQKRINKIKNIVKDFEEPYKTESFKILFEKEISKNENLNHQTHELQENVRQSKSTQNKPLEFLAKACETNIEQIRDVFEFENEEFAILKKIPGDNTAEKQINASLCILTAWAKGMNVPWLKVIDLGKAIKEIPLSTKHLGENITKTEYFVRKGNSKGAKYHITTAGLNEGIRLIKKLIGV